MNFHLPFQPNPFSTRFVRPGAIGYQRHDGRSLEELVDVFLGPLHGKASMIGPHGSGKSTLLASLTEPLAKHLDVFAYRFSTTDRDFASIWIDCRRWGPKCVVVVDGYEQLSAWSRWRLGRSIRRANAKFLMTAHRVFGNVPVLWRTMIDEELAIQLRDNLLASHPKLVGLENLEDAWWAARKKFPTDLRETFMSMYDWVEVEKQKRLASHDNSRAV